VILLLAACSEPVPEGPPAAAVWVSAQHAESGGSLTLHAPAGSTVSATAPLTVTPDGAEAWTLSGADGSYIVAVTMAEGTAPTRLFVDIGVKGPSGGEMDDLQSVPPPPPPMWPWVVAGLVGVAAVVGGGVWAFRRFTPPPPPPVDLPPHVVARRAWDALRERTDLDAPAVAEAMSNIFRTWITAAWSLPATHRTRREILDSLAGVLTAAELDAARRLLSATDLVKFAERSQHANLFEQLDQDFHAVVKPVRRV
jgi:hypothetical protein